MGGGGGYGFSPIDKKTIEEKAKDRIKEAESAQSRNVFISFAYEDMGEVNLLRGQAKNDNSELEFSDYSVKKAYNSEDSDYIKRKICEKIEKASVTMVYLSKESMKSPWVKWEIEMRRVKKWERELLQSTKAILLHQVYLRTSKIMQIL